MLVYAEPAFRTRHANPYNAGLYTAVREQGVDVRELSYLGMAVHAPAVIHLHWPELTLLSGHRTWRIVARMWLFFGLLSIARMRGSRVVWTVHNVTPHEERATPALRRRYRRLLCRNIDALVSLSAGGVPAIRAAYPELSDVPVHVTPHGHYRGLYPFRDDRGAARAELDVGERTFAVALGQVRPYKGIPELLAAVAELDDDILLGIAGKPGTRELAQELRDAADPRRVRLHLAFLTDEEIATWLCAADLVVLPYRAISNSGAAILALSAGRPVVVPAAPATRELRDMVGAEWVRLYDGDFGPDELRAAVEWSRRPRASGPDLRELDRGRIAEATVGAYRAVLR